jgi:hypothetical protein
MVGRLVDLFGLVGHVGMWLVGWSGGRGDGYQGGSSYYIPVGLAGRQAGCRWILVGWSTTRNTRIDQPVAVGDHASAISDKAWPQSAGEIYRGATLAEADATPFVLLARQARHFPKLGVYPTHDAEGVCVSNLAFPPDVPTHFQWSWSCVRQKRQNWWGRRWLSQQ